MKVIVYITPKKNLLDPQGNAVKDAMSKLGYATTGNVCVGKTIEFEIEPLNKGASKKAQVEFLTELEGICLNLLSNPVIEDYRYEVKSS